MKILFNNFFYDQDLSPFFYLFKIVFNTNIELGTLEDSDILLESMFGTQTYLYHKKWSYTFCFIGEADRRIPDVMKSKMFQDYSCVLKGELSNHNIVNFPLFVFYKYSYKTVYEYQKKEKIMNVPKKDICVIISNGTDSEGRNYFLNQLEKRVSIDYAGNYKNNVKRIEPAHCTKEFNDFVSQYKVIFSMENSKNKEYITEKILHGYNCNNIPIYWGSDSILNYFNEERFIHVKNFDSNTINQSIDKIVEVLNDDKFLEMVNKPIYKDGYIPLTLTMIAHDIQRLLGLKNTQVKKFMTYGIEPYNNVIRICDESKNIRFFNNIYGFTDKYLKNDTEFNDSIDWKPYLIKKELDKSNENDILIYCDASYKVIEDKRRLNEYIDMLNTSESDYGIITFSFDKCLDFEIIIIKKNTHSMNVINEWLNHKEKLSIVLNKYGCINLKEHGAFIKLLLPY